MIAVVFGTTGELIKLAPVLSELEDREAPVLTICTGQQVEQIPPLLDDFGLRQPDIWVGRGFNGRDLERSAWVPRWLAEVWLAFARRYPRIRRQLRGGPTKPLVLVHGDTFTTVIGSMMGRVLGVPVAHLEAGLRSGSWRHPFPEELDRRLAGRLARLHLAPSAEAVANLRASRARGEIVDTGGNTIRDALAMVRPGSLTLDLPPAPFGLVSLHRFELLSDTAAFVGILELLRRASRRVPLVFVNHPVTAAAIAAQGLERLFDRQFWRIPRQKYFSFIGLLKASAFLVTDSGGSQEECAYLGHPCLVHRARTERSEGIGTSVTLTRLDLGVAEAWLANPLAHAAEAVPISARPTDVVLRCLERAGFLSAASARGVAESAPAPKHGSEREP
jgi:UDP-N-acetylglucosamine 2-epimerase (non-hydrolysing)